MIPRTHRTPLSTLALWLLAACSGSAPCNRCDTLVIAAIGEPSSVLPPLAIETVGRDIGDQVYERLANLESGRPPMDTSAFRPALATRWTRVDSLTWRFFLRRGATWSDGQPVTAEDVVFSFVAFVDSMLDSPARPYLEGKVNASAETDSTVLVRFTHPSAEQLYDATYHVRIFPRHIWEPLPRGAWAADTSVARLVGSGPYRVTRWERGQSLTLEATPSASPSPAIKRVVWRFAADPDAALNLVLSREADLLETIGSPERVARVEADSALRAVRYPSAASGILGFRLVSCQPKAAGCQAHPVLGDRTVRRALSQAIDRPSMARATFGPETKAPPGPMSQLLWIWDDSVVTLPYDTSAAAAALDRAGWKHGTHGFRARGGEALAVDILFPATSVTRKRLAEAIQEAWRRLGVRATITSVDFPVFQQRLAKGAFDSYLGSWLDEPSPRGLADQWTRAGWGALNYGHYSNPRFDTLLARASAQEDLGAARLVWREALDTLNADAPAVFLYAPVNVAAVSKRLLGVTIDPYSWLSRLPEWSIDRGRSGGKD